jgi:hypothetical protein
MSKSRKQILQELLDLENDKVEDVEEPINNDVSVPIITETIPSKENKDDEIITKAKKPRTQKQLEAFEKAKQIRDANALKRKEEQKKKEEEERKIIEAKLVKKAISIKKKEIKKQALLDEISDDDTPIEKIKEIAKSRTTVGQSPLTKPTEISTTKPLQKISFF